MTAAYPRLLDDVHLVPGTARTMLSTPRGNFMAPGGLYPTLNRIAPLMDGTQSIAEVLDQIPPTHRKMIRALIAQLNDRGALRLEKRIRPTGMRTDLLALADRHAADPYAACAAVMESVVRVQAPSAWVPTLVTAVETFGLTASRPAGTAVEQPKEAAMRLQLGSTNIDVTAANDWLVEPLGPVERAVFAAAMVAELVCRVIGAPPVELPQRGAVPGLGRSGPRVGAAVPLLEAWPNRATLLQLLTSPSAFLPTKDPGLEPPAMLRPCPPAVAEDLPSALRAILGTVQSPLRWERGAHAHGGGRAHRGVASARALYPVEFYLVSEVAAWYLDPLELSLHQVSGDPAARPRGAGKIAVTVRENKVAHRYRRYATRLCVQEAGLAAAAVLAASESAGLPARLIPTVSDRGPRGHWGYRLDLGEDERVLGVLEVNLDTLSFDCDAIVGHSNIVRARRSGHQVFPSLGTPERGRLGDLVPALGQDGAAAIHVYLVVHRPCTTSTGTLQPGCFDVSTGGADPVSLGTQPTQRLQSGQDHLGPLAPNYGSALATVLVTAAERDVTYDLDAFVSTTFDAARPAHSAMFEAARLGLVARVHNSVPVDAVRAITRQNDALPLFQVIIGDPRPDGTLSVEIGRELGPEPTSMKEHGKERSMWGL